MDFIEAGPGSDLAGFEICRHKLWGHKSVRALGLLLLPTLAEGDIYAEGDAIAQLEADVHQILKHLSDVSAKTEFTEEFIEHRCRNILEAAGRAREIGGGVVIW